MPREIKSRQWGFNRGPFGFRIFHDRWASGASVSIGKLDWDLLWYRDV